MARRLPAVEEMRWLSVLLAGLPVAIACRLFHAPEWSVFTAAAVALVPLARWTSIAAEHTAERAGRSVGGLITATFANGSELILSILALRRGLVEVVKASITGSIIGNTLLIAGTAALVGGLRHGRQPFPVKPAGRHAAMMILALSGLCLPAVFARMQLYYTHFWRCRDGADQRRSHPRRRGAWPLGRSLAVLGGALAGTAVAGDLLVRAIESFSKTAGLLLLSPRLTIGQGG